MGLEKPRSRVVKWTAMLTIAALSFMVDATLAAITVPMTGEGATEQEATDDAIDKAFESILEKLKPAHGEKGQAYDWTRRIVAARPKHVVKGYYEIVESRDRLQNRGRGLWQVRIKVDMPKKAFDAAWQEAEAFVESIGVPTVGIAMPGDLIEDTSSTRPQTRREDGSAVAQKIKEALHEQHFHVVILDHRKILKRSHLEFAKLNAADAKALAELALSQDADLLISGDARTLGPSRKERTPGRVEWDWEAFCRASIYWSDDASELATLSEEGLGADDNREAGRILSLKNAGANLAHAFLDKVFEQWSDWAYEGGIVTLSTIGSSFSKSREIKKALKEMPDVLKITSMQTANGVTTIRFRTKRTAYSMADALDDTEFPDFGLEITETHLRTIRATVKE